MPQFYTNQSSLLSFGKRYLRPQICTHVSRDLTRGFDPAPSGLFAKRIAAPEPRPPAERLSTKAWYSGGGAYILGTMFLSERCRARYHGSQDGARGLAMDRRQLAGYAYHNCEFVHAINLLKRE